MAKFTKRRGRGAVVSGGGFTILPVDSTPDAFTFTDITDATVSTVYTSNTITVAGLGSGVSAPVVLITGGTYSKNGDGFASVATTAVNGDTFAVRHTSSASGLTATNTTLNIGGVTDTYTTTTEDVDDEFVFMTPRMTFKTGVTQDSWPLNFSWILPVNSIAGTDSLRLQVASNEAFSSLIVDDAIVIPVDPEEALVFTDLDTIVSGETWSRSRIENGANISDWTAVLKHGDTTAPVITGEEDPSDTEGEVNPTRTLTVSETTTIEVFGTDAGLVSVTSTPSVAPVWELYAPDGTDYDLGQREFSFYFVATDLAGNVSDPFPVVYTVLNDPLDNPDPQWSPRVEDKSAYVTLSNSNLTASVADNGAVGLVKSLTGKDDSDTSSFDVEVTYQMPSNFATNIYIGFCYAAAPLNEVPGYQNTDGISLHAALGGWEVYVGEALVASNYAGGGINGQTLTASRVGTTVTFFRDAVQLGTTYTLPAGTGDVFAFFAAGGPAGAATADFTDY